MKKSPLAVVLAFLATMVFGAAFAAPALAHTSLKSSDPKKNDRIETLRKVTLEFSESVRFPAVLVRGEGGKRYESGKPEVDGATVTQDVVDSLPAGAYTIAWRVVSDDGHPVEGEIPFTLVGPATPQVTAEATPSVTAPATPQVTPLVAVTPQVTPQADASAPQRGVPGWVWVVVFGLAGIGIGMLFSLRKKP